VQPPAVTVDRAMWLHQARDVLAADHGPQPGRLLVVIRAESGARSAFVLTDGPDRRPAPAPALSALEDVMVAAVRALRAEGRRAFAKAIAARMRTPCSSDFRAILRNLTRRVPPVLRSSTRRGYWEP
jgi:hypothetical protein